MRDPKLLPIFFCPTLDEIGFQPNSYMVQGVDHESKKEKLERFIYEMSNCYGSLNVRQKIIVAKKVKEATDLLHQINTPSSICNKRQKACIIILSVIMVVVFLVEFGILIVYPTYTETQLITTFWWVYLWLVLLIVFGSVLAVSALNDN